MRRSLWMPGLTWSLVLFLMLGLVTPVFAVEVPQPAPAPDVPEVVARSGSVTAEEWVSIQEQIRRAEYHPTWQTAGGAEAAYRAPNRAQGFVVAFAQRGFHATGDEAGWRFGLSLTAYGRTSMPPAVARADLRADGGTVTYHWSERVSEWYENRPEGVKHGLTLHAPPPSGDDAPRLRFALETDLVPALSADGQVLTLRAPATGRWQAGPAVLRYADLVVIDATGQTLPAHMVLASGALEIVINATGATYPLTVDPLLTTQVTTLAPPVGEEGAFGRSLAVENDTIVVGAPQDDEGGTNAGAAYVFTRNEGGAEGWGQVVKLTAADAEADAYFGYAVDLRGDTVVVSAIWDDAEGINSGAAYVFARNYNPLTPTQPITDAWGQVTKLTASDGATGDSFGQSVTLSDDLLAVGAHEDDDLGADSGSVYLFARNAGGADNWGEVTKLIAAGGTAGDHFGISVALEDDTLAVGARWDDDQGADSGSVYLFARNTGGVDNWGQVTKLTAADGAAGDQFGYSVSLSDDTLVVGSPISDDGGTDTGAAYVFARNEGGADNWGQVTKLSAALSAEDQFGFSVALDGETAVVGARWDDETGFNTGAAYVFTRNAGGADNWGQVTKLTVSGSGTGGQRGWAVALGGYTIALGSRSKEEVPLFTRSGNRWLEIEKPTAADGVVDDLFGSSVSVGENTLVVGVPNGDEGGTNAGAAYVFARNQGGADGWDQVTKLTAVDGETSDNFGLSVALDGDTIVVGAREDDDNGTDAGAAYVFARNHNPLTPTQPTADYWGQVAKLTALDGAAEDWFGGSVAVSGDTVVVGASQEDENGTDAGAAYVFTRNYNPITPTQPITDAWGQVAKLIATDGAAGDSFGFSVSVSGNTVLIGAYDDDDNGTTSGSAYVFAQNEGGGDAWGQVAKLTALDGAAGDQFGFSVSVDDDVALVGAYGDDDNGADAGSAYVFTRNAGGADVWGQVTKLTLVGGAAGDWFGFSVAVEGGTAVVGAPRADCTCPDVGLVYVFERNQGGADNWGQVEQFAAADRETNDWFGGSVSLNGNTIVVGAPYDDDLGTDAGAAYVYRWEYVLPDPVVVKRVDPPSAVPGQAITYTLVLSNAGLTTATGLVLTDSLPVSVTATSVISHGLVLTRRVGTRYAWDVGDLAPEARGVITISGVLSTPLPAGTFTNTAIITGTLDGNPANNGGDAALTVLDVPPVADDDAYVTAEDDTLVVPAATGVLAGDADANGDPLTAVLDVDVATGTLALAGDGGFVYTPTLDFNGVVTFTYHARGGGLDSNVATVTVTVTPVGDPPLVTPTVLTVSEPAGWATFTVALDGAPTAPVTVPLSTSNDECGLAVGAVVLDGSNWAAGVEVTVGAVDDDVVDGPQTCVVETGAAVSDDPDYDGLDGDDVTVTVEDDDALGVAVTPRTVTVSEDGITDVYTVVLQSEPVYSVTVTIATDGQTTVDPAALIFTPVTWDVPQGVTVTAVYDGVPEGTPHTGVISHTATSSDPAYDGLPVDGVTALITDLTRICLPLMMREYGPVPAPMAR